MKLFLMAMVTAMMSGTALAKGLYGDLVSAPSTIQVVDERGQQKEYAITSVLNTVYVSDDNKSLSLSNKGLMAMCGDHLGQLAKDFSVTVAADGTKKTVTVQASGNGREVHVYGMCQGNSNVLTQLQLDVRTGNVFDVK